MLVKLDSLNILVLLRNVIQGWEGIKIGRNPWIFVWENGGKFMDIWVLSKCCTLMRNFSRKVSDDI